MVRNLKFCVVIVTFTLFFNEPMRLEQLASITLVVAGMLLFYIYKVDLKGIFRLKSLKVAN